MKSRYNTARKILIFWTLFIGVGAVGGATAMFVDPSGKTVGMAEMLPYFKALPFADVLFTDFVFPGCALLIVNGLTNITAAILLIAKNKLGNVLGCVFGVTLMLWICIQFYMFPLNFMSTAYFVFGFLQAVTGYATVVFYKQERFTVDEAEYKHIGENPKKLVVYFSRMGYVKKIAHEEADKLGAEVYEIKPKERTQGTLGFWWCGRYALHRWAMPIKEIDIDLEKYESVTICSAIWAFSLSAVTRAFCLAAKGKIKSADYILVHHTNGIYEKAADEADELLGIKRSSLRSVRCRTGKFKRII